MTDLHPFLAVIGAALVLAVAYEGACTTLGYGDLVPDSGPWQLLTTVAAGNGLLLFTLSITYAIPIISAATEKKQLATTINAMGESPRAIMETTRADDDFANLRDQIQQIQQPIAGTGQKHLAYPILHYFHSPDTMTALPLALVRLDQALTIILFGVPDLRAATRAQLIITQRVINSFLGTLESAFIRPADETPRIPSLDDHAELPGIQRSAAKIRAHLSAQQKQKLLFAYVEDDGWDWSQVWQVDRQR